MSPLVQWLHDGRRLHLQHGPIDLIIDVTGRITGDVTGNATGARNYKDLNACSHGDGEHVDRKRENRKHVHRERADREHADKNYADNCYADNNSNKAAATATQRAFQRAVDRFQTVLVELVEELPTLRSPTCTACCDVNGSVATRMWQAASHCDDAVGMHHTGSGVGSGKSFAHGQTTPMIAVAGSVADEILNAMLGDDDTAAQLHNVCVNNGGDIALYLGDGARYRVGVVANPDDADINGTVELCHSDGIGGVATSGWRGRSFSLGIADSVTVLAASASIADAAATLIANSVNVDSAYSARCNADSLIERQPACELDPDTDLRDTAVTTHVHQLPQHLIDHALNRGHAVAAALEKHQVISGACLFLQGSQRVTGHLQNAIEFANVETQQNLPFASAETPVADSKTPVADAKTPVADSKTPVATSTTPVANSCSGSELVHPALPLKKAEFGLHNTNVKLKLQQEAW